MATKKRVALAYELETLAASVEGVVLLAELAANDDLSTEAQRHRAPRIIASLLEVVHQRLLQVVHATRSGDAARIWSQSNDAGGEVGLTLPVSADR